MGYLDNTGLAHLWEKVKAAIDEKPEGVTALEVYSTEETRIGTWIDGKPLYRRVFKAVMPAANSQWTVINQYTDDVTGCMLRSYCTDPSNGTIEPLPTTAGSGSSLMPTKTNFEPGVGIKVFNSGNWYVGRDVVSVLYYTKTTDEATIQTETQAAAADVSPFGYDMGADIPVMPTTTTAQFYEEV